jgi:polysaccharide export outer membrane protein
MIAGCTSQAYRVSNLPIRYLAPAPQTVETANLGGLANSSVSCEVIQPGDVIDVTMINDYTKLTASTTPVRVAKDGSIIAPLIGKVNVAGLEAEQAEQLLASESISRGVFRNPNITVTIRQTRTVRVTVAGAVNKPGTVELPRGSSSLLGAIIAADGLSKEASPEVEIRRTDVRTLSQMERQSGIAPVSYSQGTATSAEPVVEKVNLKDINAQSVIRSPDLFDGDVVYVPKQVLKPIYAIGLVRKPGEIPYPVTQEMRILDAIALAGGLSTSLADDIVVIRQLPGQSKPIRISISYQKAKDGSDNLLLAPGDTMTVEHTPVTAVADLIQNFFRFGIGASASIPMF